MSWYIGNGKSGNGKVDKRSGKSSKPKEKYAKLSACKKFADMVSDCFKEVADATVELEERVNKLEEDIQELKNPKTQNPPATKSNKKCSDGDGSNDVIITIEQSPGKRVKLKLL